MIVGVVVIVVAYMDKWVDINGGLGEVDRII